MKMHRAIAFISLMICGIINFIAASEKTESVKLPVSLQGTVTAIEKERWVQDLCHRVDLLGWRAQ